MKLLVALLVAAPLAARAGDFRGGGTQADMVRQLERYAAGKSNDLMVACLQYDLDTPVPTELAPRIVAACEKAVLLSERKRDDTDDYFCVEMMLTSGLAQVGDRDLVGEVIAKGGTWQDQVRHDWLADTGDARVRDFVLAQRTADVARWKKMKHHRPWARDDWTKNELRVLAALAKVGIADDLALVDEIAAEHPKDKRVIRAAAAARAALAPR